MFALAKVTGAETTAGVFFLVTFGLLGFFNLPVGTVFDISRKRPRLRYLAYALIAVAVISWIAALSAGIGEEEANKPVIIRGVNIVKEGAYAENVIVACNLLFLPREVKLQIQLNGKRYIELAWLANKRSKENHNWPSFG